MTTMMPTTYHLPAGLVVRDGFDPHKYHLVPHCGGKDFIDVMINNMNAHRAKAH